MLSGFEPTGTVAPNVNVPSPLPSSMTTALAVGLVTAKSIFPSPLKSPATIAYGKSFAGGTVAVPAPSGLSSELIAVVPPTLNGPAPVPSRTWTDGQQGDAKSSPQGWKALATLGLAGWKVGPAMARSG